ncbi:MAG: multifunctional oxoglutarate decarboxylase/oxoglutarate dehydrogenase thiamine pyrophosphate-binding subunit/dihydrolipoyllysine-residue succinyltransferase subunit [Acidobacteriota bacterium]
MTTSYSYGANFAFIEELHEKYLHDPSSVSANWREFFEGYAPARPEDAYIDELEESLAQTQAAAAPMARHVSLPSAPAPAPSTAAVSSPKTPPAAPVSSETGSVAEEAAQKVVPLRGVASRIVQNMESSLSVPTATSVRVLPVKVLEENRRTINAHLAMVGQPKASYTHVIGWAIVKALKDFPRMNSSFVMNDGQPARIDRDRVNLGLAIDVEKKDGSRSLVVPNVKNAETLDFAGFLKNYNDLVRKARNNSLEIADFEGTSISLTNPGTIGTVSSIPRLMESQGTIVATGQIDYPAEYSAADPMTLADLGISKVMTITSTYDHRIIQGAESGAFLAKIHSLLIGEDGFYTEIFRDLRIPYEPEHWSMDRRSSVLNSHRDESIRREAAVLQLINVYRVRGHLLADLDPLEYKVGHHSELNLASWGLTIWDLDREFLCGGLCGNSSSKLRDILDTLRQTYCSRLGAEYMHIQDPVQKKWLQDQMEPTRNSAPLDGALKRRILVKLNDAEAFERFLHTKYVGHKRFSMEGAETAIPLLDHILNLCGQDAVEEVVMGMAHRGRLNVLANILGKSYEKIFHEFEGDIDPNTTQGSGDVKYHLGAEGTHTTTDGRDLDITLASNPSHLEAVDPIVEGMVRSKQKLSNDFSRSRVIPLLIHGDAAFAGQGVVAETLNFSQLRGYKTGGTIHFVINNQIGFTTGSEAARSTTYATDVAKMVQAPIFHVNGDDPEACIRAATLAYRFRQEFKKDVVIDMVCYRRHGHNEGDEPSLTQPRMYKLIKEHRSVRKLYTETLLRKGDLDPEEAERWLEAFQQKLQEAFDRTRESDSPPPVQSAPLWTDEDVTGYQNSPSVDTSVNTETLQKVGEAITTLREGFTIHPKLRGLIEKRKAMVSGAQSLDWATAEALAFGTLLMDGFRVRLSGQDSGRGTFSQRHAVLFDFGSGARFTPLNLLASDQGYAMEEPDIVPPEQLDAIRAEAMGNGAAVNFSVYDSLLSEYGVLGFEYGYSVADPNTLVLWEAQFGDFMNGAQIVIDQFITSAEEKWGQHSGVVLLLPHGYEGQGPEHSSARLERFLILSAEGNMFVVNATTPAQYFHVLRRQMQTNPRKPLVIMTPKSLLRHPRAVSSVQELLEGRFEPVLDDPRFGADAETDRGAVSRILITSGKIFYELDSARTERNAGHVAVLRLEQFYPWPDALLRGVLARYANATEVVWVQEEPRNMGGWDFIDERLIGALRQGQTLKYVGRPFSASPATGSHHRHEEQQKAIVEMALEAGS